MYDIVFDAACISNIVLDAVSDIVLDAIPDIAYMSDIVLNAAISDAGCIYNIISDVVSGTTGVFNTADIPGTA